MIYIENLNIRLPNHFKPYAEYISRRVGENLSRVNIEMEGRIDTITVPPIKSQSWNTPENIAQEVSKQIINSIREGR